MHDFIHKAGRAAGGGTIVTGDVIVQSTDLIVIDVLISHPAGHQL